ncbi:MAG: hypothetical protein QOJ04_5680, partial [Caballeronia sp.]|nr:hypothetical protein [Caballeronia sp.]
MRGAFQRLAIFLVFVLRSVSSGSLSEGDETRYACVEFIDAIRLTVADVSCETRAAPSRVAAQGTASIRLRRVAVEHRCGNTNAPFITFRGLH